MSGNIKYLERDGKVDVLKQFDMIESLHICQGVYLFYGIVLFLLFVVLNRCNILELQQIHVFEVSVFSV